MCILPLSVPACGVCDILVWIGGMTYVVSFSQTSGVFTNEVEVNVTALTPPS